MDRIPDAEQPYLRRRNGYQFHHPVCYGWRREGGLLLLCHQRHPPGGRIPGHRKGLRRQDHLRGGVRLGGAHLPAGVDPLRDHRYACHQERKVDVGHYGRHYGGRRHRDVHFPGGEHGWHRYHCPGLYQVSQRFSGQGDPGAGCRHSPFFTFYPFLRKGR